MGSISMVYSDPSRWRCTSSFSAGLSSDTQPFPAASHFQLLLSRAGSHEFAPRAVLLVGRQRRQQRRSRGMGMTRGRPC